MTRNKTKIVIDEDEKGVLWLRASPVNLVVSISDEKIYVWTCEKGVNEGHSIFRLKAVKRKDGGWDIKYAKTKREKT